MTYTRTFKDVSYRTQRFYSSPGSNPDTIKDMTVTGTRTGEKVLDWKEKLREGKSASSAYYSDRSKVVYGDPLYMTCNFRSYLEKIPPFRPDILVEITGHPHALGVNPMADHLTTNLGEAEAMALSKTYKKLQSEQQHMNSPAIIAEFLDVIRQFGKPAEALVDLTNRRLNRLELERRGLKGSTSFKKIRYAEIVASTWLEYSFGLAPLISDTKDAAEALARWQLERDNPELVHLRKKIQSRGLSVASSNNTYALSISPVRSASGNTSLHKTKTEHRVQYTVGLQGEISAAYGSNERLLSLLGFNHANWIPAAWEAVPWSWLVDYFSNVQQILDASVTNTTRVAWISKAVTQKTTNYYVPSIRPGLIVSSFDAIGYSPASAFIAKGTGAFKTERTTLTRSIPTSLGVPPLVVEHPFDKANKIANMVAVLFKKKGNSALWIT